jgi:hypothetical protein
MLVEIIGHVANVRHWWCQLPSFVPIAKFWNETMVLFGKIRFLALKPKTQCIGQIELYVFHPCQCSIFKSSMPFKCDLALQNIPLSKHPSKRNPKLKMKTSLEALNIICMSQEPTKEGHYQYKKWS